MALAIAMGFVCDWPMAWWTIGDPSVDDMIAPAPMTDACLMNSLRFEDMSQLEILCEMGKLEEKVDNLATRINKYTGLACSVKDIYIVWWVLP